jgi:hypothetical protein
MPHIPAAQAEAPRRLGNAMLCFAVVLLTSFCALAGCQTTQTAPNGTPNSPNRAQNDRTRSDDRPERLTLPEDELATTERLERIVQPGMPIEEARETLERYGFRCRYEEAIGVPYLYGVEVKERHRWPFRAVWSTTIYHKNGFVTSVHGHYDPAVVERGIRIPPKRLDRYPSKTPGPPDGAPVEMVRKDVEPKTDR